MEIADQLAQAYGLTGMACADLNIAVNDVLRIVSSQGEFALKLYNIKSRNRQNVAWEMDLLQHLKNHNIPVSAPISGINGFLQEFHYQGEPRIGALFPWAAGSKPAPSPATYRILGEAAAQTHSAADSFTSSHPREVYDLEMLIDTQLVRLRSSLEQMIHLMAGGAELNELAHELERTHA